jgi:CBS domain-containing protein
MSLGALINNKLITCSLHDSVKDVASKMKQDGVGSILVTEDQRPVGIITDRDLVLRCVARDADCSSMNAADIMSGPAVTIGSDAGVYDVVRVMKSNKIRRVAVVNQMGKAIGLLSFGDLFQLIAHELHDLSTPGVPRMPKIVEQFSPTQRFIRPLAGGAADSFSRPGSRMFTPFLFVAVGATVGAGLAFLLDRESGSHRRAQVRDWSQRRLHDARGTLEQVIKYARRRVGGTAAGARNQIRQRFGKDETIASSDAITQSSESGMQDIAH